MNLKAKAIPTEGTIRIEGPYIAVCLGTPPADAIVMALFTGDDMDAAKRYQAKLAKESTRDVFSLHEVTFGE